MTARLPFVLCFFNAALWLSWVPPTRAESVLFASSEERTAELLPELTLALRAHDLLLLARTLGDARTPLERAAAAQRIGRNVGTWAALWIEREPPLRVRAVAISGEHIFEAPLPAPLESVEPRVFASVAASVLLEALGRTREGTPPVVLDATPSGPAAAPASAPAWAEDGSGSAPQTTAGPRFFLRAGVGYGFVFVGQGAASDRSPSDVLNEVADQARLPDNGLDLDKVDQLLRAHGYDCQVSEDAMQRLQVDQCAVAVNPGGLVGSFSFDLALGARILPRLALALTARIATDAGEGTMAHTVVGLQLEGALVKPRSKGFWLNGLAGAGFGRIQAKPPSEATFGPYATSGPGNVRVGVQLGYRFTEHFGFYTGTTLHFMMPDKLFALEPTLGIEARL